MRPTSILTMCCGGPKAATSGGIAGPRIAFLREILEFPPGPLEPDRRMSMTGYPTATNAGRYYLQYLGLFQTRRRTLRITGPPDLPRRGHRHLEHDHKRRRHPQRDVSHRPPRPSVHGAPYNPAFVVKICGRLVVVKPAVVRFRLHGVRERLYVWRLKSHSQIEARSFEQPHQGRHRRLPSAVLVGRDQRFAPRLLARAS